MMALQQYGLFRPVLLTDICWAEGALCDGAGKSGESVDLIGVSTNGDFDSSYMGQS